MAFSLRLTMDGRVDVGRAQPAQKYDLSSSPPDERRVLIQAWHSHDMLPSISQVEDLRLSRNLPLLGDRDGILSSTSMRSSQEGTSAQPSRGVESASSRNVGMQVRPRRPHHRAPSAREALVHRTPARARPRSRRTSGAVVTRTTPWPSSAPAPGEPGPAGSRTSPRTRAQPRRNDGTRRRKWIVDSGSKTTSIRCATTCRAVRPRRAADPIRGSTSWPRRSTT